MIARLIAATLFTVCLALLPADDVDASVSQVVHVEPALRDEHLLLSANLHLELNEPLRTAVMGGVTLYFTADLCITQPRWWWFDRRLVQTNRTWSVSYNALTRQWRVGTQGETWQVSSLTEAMQTVQQIRDWSVADASLFEPNVSYDGALRLRLDTSRLARPFQINALNSRSWAIETPWAHFSFTPGDVGDLP